MKKWEYQSLLTSPHGFFVGGVMQPKMLSFDGLLNRLGEEGWELVGVTPVGDHDQEYYFKREKT